MKKEKQENIVGTRIGIYDVLYECDYKSNDGHRLFHVKCPQCGWETDIQMHHIKYTKNYINKIMKPDLSLWMIYCDIYLFLQNF